MDGLPIDPSSGLLNELSVAIDAAQAASTVILEHYRAATAAVRAKCDGSPVTDADIAADAAIRETITLAFPDDALLTEEGANNMSRLENPRVWIVDPIDGTAQFVAHTGRFDVMIALAIEGKPVVAVTMQPTTGLMHAAVAGHGAWRTTGDSWTTFVLSSPASPPRIVGSKYYLEPQVAPVLGAVATDLGSEQPPVMDVGFQPRTFDDLERWYDVFVGFPQDPTIFAAQEWDIAASDLIVHEAGGRLTDVWGRPHRYNKKRDTNVHGGVLASVSPGLHEAVIAALAPYLTSHPQAPGNENGYVE